MTGPVQGDAAPPIESVWDYPRPPRLEPVAERLRVVFAGHVVAETEAGFRVLETSHPPVYYFPPDSVVQEFLVPAPGRSHCEYKGRAGYWSLELPSGQRAERVAWSYPEPSAAFAAIRDHFAFYASRVESCWVGEERVKAQEGDFYGGWITARIAGPFKGGPGTFGW
ncbi:MAG: DUF427 domain-containing protein [Kiloniellales bacterium]|nr:DUF427 domain-containing protein [Kiloniellales bacterium]